MATKENLGSDKALRLLTEREILALTGAPNYTERVQEEFCRVNGLALPCGAGDVDKTVLVGRDDKSALARHFGESPKYSVEGALALAEKAARKAGPLTMERALEIGGSAVLPAGTGQPVKVFPATPDEGCICRGNWRLIVSEIEHLIGKNFVAQDGKEYNFFGLVHAEDDYYYGMWSKDHGLRLLSCTGDLDSWGYAAV